MRNNEKWSVPQKQILRLDGIGLLVTIANLPSLPSLPKQRFGNLPGRRSPEGQALLQGYRPWTVLIFRIVLARLDVLLPMIPLSKRKLAGQINRLRQTLAEAFHEDEALPPGEDPSRYAILRFPQAPTPKDDWMSLEQRVAMALVMLDSETSLQKLIDLCPPEHHKVLRCAGSLLDELTMERLRQENFVPLELPGVGQVPGFANDELEGFWYDWLRKA